MDASDENPNHRSGFVALVGRPNVGKSTLINRLMGQDIAAVSAREQTTRRSQMGILTLAEAQIIFIDTPGIHRPHHKLGEGMNIDAEQATSDADVLLVLFDLAESPNEDDRRVAKNVLAITPQPPLLVGLNKIDALPESQLDDRQAEYSQLMPGLESLALSARSGLNLDTLLARLIDLLPPGPQLYPQDQVTDLYERDIAADLIRAAALTLLREEVPHCIAVRIDTYKERNASGAYIEATLFVERDSQKGIVIGKGGSMLKEIGTIARLDIERMSGRKVFLKLRVKVQPKWRNDPAALQRFGYKAPAGHQT